MCVCVQKSGSEHLAERAHVGWRTVESSKIGPGRCDREQRPWGRKHLTVCVGRKQKMQPDSEPASLTNGHSQGQSVENLREEVANRVTLIQEGGRFHSSRKCALTWWHSLDSTSPEALWHAEETSLTNVMGWLKYRMYQVNFPGKQKPQQGAEASFLCSLVGCC